MGSSCPNGYTNINGLCYAPCPHGYELNNIGQCISSCPYGWNQTNKVCIKPYPSSYFRGDGITSETECIKINSNRPCQKDDDKWYPVCIAGYEGIGNTCYIECPNGNCERTVVDPDTPPISASLTWYIIYIIIILIIIALIIIYNAVMNIPSDITTVTDIVYGKPGTSDISSIIDPPRNELIYV